MAVFLTALILLHRFPLLASVVVLGVIGGSVAAARKHGKLALFVIGPLVDLLFLAPAFLAVGMALSDPTDGAAMLIDAYHSTIKTSLTINLAADVPLVWLAAGGRLPEWMLPLRGLWARKLLAGAAILTAILSPAPMVTDALHGMQVGYYTTPGVPAWVALLPFVVLGMLGIDYVTPLWLVLVHGWNWLKPPDPHVPANPD